MVRGTGAAETSDGRPTVAILRDEGPSDRQKCSSYSDAIAVVRAKQATATAVKIIDRDGDIVFTTATMEIDEWERIWREEMSRTHTEIPINDCPYDDIACVGDDLCGQCEINAFRERGISW